MRKMLFVLATVTIFAVSVFAVEPLRPQSARFWMGKSSQ